MSQESELISVGEKGNVEIKYTLQSGRQTETRNIKRLHLGSGQVSLGPPFLVPLPTSEAYWGDLLSEIGRRIIGIQIFPYS